MKASKNNFLERKNYKQDSTDYCGMYHETQEGLSQVSARTYSNITNPNLLQTTPIVLLEIRLSEKSVIWATDLRSAT